MRTFIDYLKEREYSEQTIEQIVRSKNRYRKWLKENNSSAYLANNNTAIQYIRCLRDEYGFKPITINLKLAHLRHYYNFLATTKNPFFNLRVRGQKKTVRVGWLNEDELLTLYMALPESTVLECRAKILAGFYIFQGVSTSDLLALRVQDVNLEENIVIIPQTRRANERTLALNPIQQILLSKLLGLPPKGFIYQELATANQDKWVVKHLHLSLLKHDGYTTLSNIRYSVIQNWIKRHNLRQVQYNAGHRYITTTEKLLQEDYEGLKLAIMDKHPLG